MSIEQAQKASQISLVCLFLGSLLGIEHLAASEILRLAIVTFSLVWSFIHYSDRLDRKASVDRGAAIVLALTAAYVATQFDPATSTIGTSERFPSLNSGYLVGMVFSTIPFVAVLASPAREAIHFSQWDRADRIVLGVIVGAVSISVLSQLVIGGRLEQDVLLRSSKILSYGFIWVGVTRLYTGNVWEPSGPGLRSFVFDRWRGPLAAALVLFTFTVVYGAVRVGLVYYHFDHGQVAFAHEQYDVAKAHYEKATDWNRNVRLDWASDRYMADLASIYFREGDAAAGENAIGYIRNRTVDPIESSAKAADIYLQAGRWNQAVRLYQGVLAARGRDTHTLDKLGRAYLGLKDTKHFLRISEEFNYVPQTGAESFDEVVLAGNIHFYRGSFNEAREIYEQASKIRPKDGYPIYKVGLVLHAQGEYDRAIAIFERAITLEPDFADAYFQIGVCQEAKGDTTAALGSYVRAVEILPNHIDGPRAIERLSGD